MTTPKAIPCVLCVEPLPAMFGGAYDDAPKNLYGWARCWCCPTCIKRLGWRRAYYRATSILNSLRAREVAT